MPDYVDLPTGPTHWIDYGGEGRPIVLVHGLGGSATNWNVVAPSLTRLGRVTALDLPGFGLTPPGPDWTLETHAAAIAAFIEYLGAPAALIGNSMGGLLAEMVASENDELVDSLILVAPATPPVLPDPSIDWSMAGRLLIGATPGLGLALNRRLVSRITPREMVNEALRRITHKPGRVPMELIEDLTEVAEIRSSYPWAGDAVPRTAQSIRSLFLKRRTFVEMIREIKAPTLVVQGVADPVVSPTAVEWLCALRLDWELVQMGDTGHTPHIDAPVRFLDTVVPWLERRLVGDIQV